MNLTNLDNQKPEIKFPCEWSYKVIGSVKEDLESAIESTMGTKAYFITKTNKSSKGSYISITIKLTVLSQEEIDRYYNSLNDQEHVKIVL